jgi:hypothetical protein
LIFLFDQRSKADIDPDEEEPTSQGECSLHLRMACLMSGHENASYEDDDQYRRVKRPCFWRVDTPEDHGEEVEGKNDFAKLAAKTETGEPVGLTEGRNVKEERLNMPGSYDFYAGITDLDGDRLIDIKDEGV